MAEFGITDAELLRKTQAEVPPDCRQNAVLIEFWDAIDKRFVWDFYRIGLTEVHLEKGENDRGEETFYRPEIFQPHRCGVKFCAACGQPNLQRSLTVSICQNSRCLNFKREILDGPVRGVVRVDVPSNFVVGVEQIHPRTRWGHVLPQTIEITLTRGALLILDRRYPESVRAAVWRTAKALGEMKGWKIKG